MLICRSSGTTVKFEIVHSFFMRDLFFKKLETRDCGVVELCASGGLEWSRFFT